MRNTIIIASWMILLSSPSNAQWIQTNIARSAGDRSIETYIIYTDKAGRFSNSTTINSEVTVQVLMKYERGDSLPEIGFNVYQYGREPAVGKSAEDAQYELTISLPDNTGVTYYLSADEHSLSLGSDQRGDRISFVNRLESESKPIKCSLIIYGKHQNDSYNFTIDPNGLSDALSRIKPK